MQESTHRVLFHYPIFNIGGAEMSSLRLMNALADRGWDVTLVLTTGGGPMEPMLDSRIRVVRLRPWISGSRFKTASGLLEKMWALPDLIAYIFAVTIGTVRMLPFLLVQYQSAVTLLHGTSTWFIRRVVKAKVRVHWIRNDLARAEGTKDHVTAIAAASSEIDQYICVSGVVQDSLVRAVPEIKDKTCVIYNILNAEVMRQRSSETGDPFPAKPEGSLRILTVCRLSEAPKGLVRMARVCRGLVNQGCQFQWFVIGDGPDKALLERSVAELQLQSHMILLGSSENPFPAYRHCDLVAVLSKYEGLCGVVNEAKLIGKPVIATSFAGIEEQLVHGETGYIVDNDEESILNGISTLFADSRLRKRLSVAGLPPDLLDDESKLDKIQSIFHYGGLKHSIEKKVD